jgi:hypothetical protein
MPYLDVVNVKIAFGGSDGGEDVGHPLSGMPTFYCSKSHLLNSTHPRGISTKIGKVKAM